MYEALESCENNNWKELKSFEKFVRYNKNALNDEEKKIAAEKVEHMMNIMKVSIEKHFDAWTNQFLEFCLFSEQETAQVAAKYLLGEETENSSIFSHLNYNLEESLISTHSIYSTIYEGLQE